MARGYNKTSFYRLSAKDKAALVADIVDWHAHGLKYVEIAFAMGVPADLVARWGRRAGLPKPKRRKPRVSRAKTHIVPDLPGEHWRPVVGWESRYLISDHGRFKSIKAGKLLLRKPNPAGYMYFGLSSGERREYKSAHSMILEAFVGPRPPGYVARHLDGSRTNRLDNLEWSTHSQNMFDVWRDKGKPIRPVTNLDIRAIASGLRRGVSQTRLAELFEVSTRVVAKIKQSQTQFAQTF